MITSPCTGCPWRGIWQEGSTFVGGVRRRLALAPAEPRDPASVAQPGGARLATARRQAEGGGAPSPHKRQVANSLLQGARACLENSGRRVGPLQLRE